MVVGLMSDTHGNRTLMGEIADLIRERFSADLIIHAGDTYADGQQLALSGHNVRSVPGPGCPQYDERDGTRTFVESYGGLRFACAHVESDLHWKELSAAVIITGHTHIARVERIGRSLYVNPGHLKSDSDNGELASFGIIHIGDQQVDATILEINGEVRTTLAVPRTSIG